VPAELLEAVDRAYQQADEDRLLLERSLDLTSQELLERNRQLREDFLALDRVKREREESEARYRRLFDENLTGVLVSSPDGRILECNRAFAEIFGFASPADAVGFKVAQLYRSPEERQALIARVRAEGKVCDVEMLGRRPDGRSLHLAVSVVGTFDEDGDLVAILGFLSDDTHRCKLEEQLRQSQKLEAVGRLAGGIAHDFNNLLTAILGYCDLVQMQVIAEGRAYPALEEIHRAGRRAAELTRQLLAFSRRQVSKPGRLQLNGVVVQMKEMLRRLIREDVELVTDLAPRLGEVLADAGQLEQVITNLVVNARDAMPSGGRVTLVTEEVEVSPGGGRPGPPLAPGHYVRLEVRDTGHGIDPALVERIFEPFFTTKEVGEGTGLGLSVVYGIIKQSGGDIRVASEPGAGTAISIYLPRAEAGAHRAAATAAPPPAALDGEETILLVEDEPQVRQLTAKILAERGYRILEAAAGPEALDLATSFDGPIHLLLSDVVMPGMPGPALARQMVERRPAIRVLFMSGYSEGAAAGAGDPVSVLADAPLLQKPFEAHDLLAAVRDVLSARLGRPTATATGRRTG
jgi:PAS domain S-box-containing protein